MAIWILLVLIIIVGFLAIAIFNKLVRSRNQAKNGFAQIDVQLKRRHDLIPSLVETAKRYLQHEEHTLTQVIQARNQAQALQNTNTHNPESLAHMARFAEAEGLLSKALGQFSMVVENYPELKADSIMRDLMQELTNTENRIGFARQHYNDSVMMYNNEREMFPNNLLSGAFGFVPMSQLEFADKAAIDQAPTVNFGR
ncbi:LemA family protein [Psychrobacter sp. I-STPA10]|uniref:LemA family protein n=1 Tax=Psychrobacter sp. I-STPA10 TaxID=2585769 RepID=UPI001E635C03|nr:LemA family protein [Psychrobacter sp. I-STPA10]